MGYETGFRRRGVPPGGRLPESVRERFWEAVNSGLSPTAAATVAGVHGGTGRRVVGPASRHDWPRAGSWADRVGLPGTGGSRGGRGQPQAAQIAPPAGPACVVGRGGDTLEAAAQSSADRGAAAPGFPRRPGDVGVTRDDLPSPLRPAPRGVGPTGQDRAAYRTDTTETRRPQHN